MANAMPSHCPLRSLSRKIAQPNSAMNTGVVATIHAEVEADLVFDVRFLQNPYYVPELRRLSGLTDGVRTYVLDQPLARGFLDGVQDLLALTIPAYVGEGKTRLTIAIGCTGGYHRSIALAEELGAWLAGQAYGPVSIFHRELERR